MDSASRTTDGRPDRSLSSGSWRAIRAWPSQPCDAQQARSDVVEAGPAPGRPTLVQLVLAGGVVVLLAVAIIG